MLVGNVFVVHISRGRISIQAGSVSSLRRLGRGLHTSRHSLPFTPLQRGGLILSRYLTYLDWSVHKLPNFPSLFIICLFPSRHRTQPHLKTLVCSSFTNLHTLTTTGTTQHHAFLSSPYFVVFPAFSLYSKKDARQCVFMGRCCCSGPHQPFCARQSTRKTGHKTGDWSGWYSVHLDDSGYLCGPVLLRVSKPSVAECFLRCLLMRFV